MEIRLKKITRSEAVLKFIKESGKGFDTSKELLKEIPKDLNAFNLKEFGFISRMCGFNNQKYDALNSMMQTLFWAGVWYAKLYPDDVVIEKDKKVKPEMSSKDYIG